MSLFVPPSAEVDRCGFVPDVMPLIIRLHLYSGGLIKTISFAAQKVSLQHCIVVALHNGEGMKCLLVIAMLTRRGGSVCSNDVEKAD